MFHQQSNNYCEIQHEHFERRVVLVGKGGLIFFSTFLWSPENGWTVLHLPCKGPQFCFPPAPTSPGCSSYSGIPTSTSLSWVVCQSESLSRAKCLHFQHTASLLVGRCDMSRPVTLCNSNKMSYIYIDE